MLHLCAYFDGSYQKARSSSSTNFCFFWLKLLFRFKRSISFSLPRIYDPFDLPGIPFKRKDELLLHFELSGQLMFANGVCTNRIMVAIFFRRYKYAAEGIGKYHTQMSKRNFIFQMTFYVFFEGLVAFQMCRSKIDVHKW